ncbi:hypothetical protein ACGFWD_31270 [Streptomyces sp. NPDC048448]|uniref:hypothetical protein n=1 Tax=unclassified Streptomyces TaxID=2593676 RepID=UPI00143E7311|nr:MULTISPECIES: hypothetical protein [unclassified Streptomyces]QIY61043.1 hypothetical protein HEP85_04255 [Streptomyces sp. RPA4-2]
MGGTTADAHLFHDITDRAATAGTQPLTVVRDEGPDTSTGEQRCLPGPASPPPSWRRSARYS